MAKSEENKENEQKSSKRVEHEPNNEDIKTSLQNTNISSNKDASNESSSLSLRQLNEESEPTQKKSLKLENTLISKKITIKLKSYKALKKIVIDLNLDDDGKMTPAMIGQAIDSIIEERQ